MKKRRLVSLILIAILLFLSACQNSTTEATDTNVTFFKDPATLESGTESGTPNSQDAQPEESAINVDTQIDSIFTPSVSKEEFPVLDGSTSMVPLGVGLKEGILGMSHEEAEADSEFHRTTASFEYLMSGESDLLLVAQPDDSVFEEIEAMGLEYEMDPIAIEGLAFLVNRGNPVDSLTIDQVRGIYSGEITNWSEVGGEDREIAAFQRNSGSGSQVMMLNTVMKGFYIKPPAMDVEVHGMQALITGLETYNNDANAIGYTVFYYASDMKMADGLKILKIDGVEPNRETIASGEYPFTSYYYEAMLSRDKSSEETIRLYDWLRSPDGKRLISELGYVPTPDDTTNNNAQGLNQAQEQAQNQAQDGDGAGSNSNSNLNYNVNWSVFDEVPFVYVMDRFSDKFIDGYIAGSSDCEIFPYTGFFPGSYEDIYGETSKSTNAYMANSIGTPKFGFVNANGVIVCDPVYTKIIDLGDVYVTFIDGESSKVGFVSKDGKNAYEQECHSGKGYDYFFTQRGLIFFEKGVGIRCFDYTGKPIIEYVINENDENIYAKVFIFMDPYFYWGHYQNEDSESYYAFSCFIDNYKNRNTPITNIESGINRDIVTWYGDRVNIFQAEFGYYFDDMIYSDCHVKDGDVKAYVMSKPDGGFDILDSYYDVVNSIGGNVCYLYKDFILTADSEDSNIVTTYDYSGNLIASGNLPDGIKFSHIVYINPKAQLIRWSDYMPITPSFVDREPVIIHDNENFFVASVDEDVNADKFYFDKNLNIINDTESGFVKAMTDNVTGEIYVITRDYIQSVSTNKRQYFSDEYSRNVVMAIRNGRICIVSDGFRYEHIVDIDGNVYFAYEATDFNDFNRF